MSYVIMALILLLLFALLTVGFAVGMGLGGKK